MVQRQLHYILIVIALLLFGPAGCKGGNNSQTVSKSAIVGEQFQPGAPAPEFLLSDLSGKKVALADLRGKVVLLNFWATWCVPCVTEMPALERVYKRYASRGLELVAVNVDYGNNEAVSKFIEDRGITFKVLLDPEMSLPPVFGVSGFPETFFIDRRGKFQSVIDPGNGKQAVRLISDRPWDSQSYSALFEAVLAGGAT